MEIDHRTEIEKLTFRALALRRSFFWEASLSPVLPCLRTLNLRNLFSFLLGAFSVIFFDDFWHCNLSPSEGKCLRRSVNSSTPALSV